MALVGYKIGREEQMRELVKGKVAEAKENEWRLKLFGRKDIPIKDLAAPLLGIIDWANDYINNAMSSSPYASVAWAGVSLLLPVSYFPYPPLRF